MSVRWAAQMSKIEKEMVDNKVELQIADEVKLTIEAREAREDDLPAVGDVAEAVPAEGAELDEDHEEGEPRVPKVERGGEGEE